ncbi:hypothetical protein [Aneurinibacillus uraniidurans]|uniref:hypothetical protein n=1 Tax=Aneurinibacillus uraniidurans TaxID=2966586 RepID=UPI00234975B5|nr:hypothetical protein [Aneurinibacillus sp. B1]WCN38805.1 hypothetical protein PO771_05235 [Aneurinibacillus sp. B1]
MGKEFELRILKQYWLGDESEDLCSHGEIVLRVRNLMISSEEDGEWNISESALALLRTVVADFPCDQIPKYYVEGIQDEEYLIFHCGCYMMFCPMNIGWQVKHENAHVLLTDFKKNEGSIKFHNLEIKVPLSIYANEIYTFAIEAKQLYEGHQKKLIDNELFQGQYHQFWEEYNELLEQVKTIVNT